MPPIIPSPIQATQSRARPRPFLEQLALSLAGASPGLLLGILEERRLNERFEQEQLAIQQQDEAAAAILASQAGTPVAQAGLPGPQLPTPSQRPATIGTGPATAQPSIGPVGVPQAPGRVGIGRVTDPDDPNLRDPSGARFRLEQQRQQQQLAIQARAAEVAERQGERRIDIAERELDERITARQETNERLERDYNLRERRLDDVDAPLADAQIKDIAGRNARLDEANAIERLRLEEEINRGWREVGLAQAEFRLGERDAWINIFSANSTDPKIISDAVVAANGLIFDTPNNVTLDDLMGQEQLELFREGKIDEALQATRSLRHDKLVAGRRLGIHQDRIGQFVIEADARAGEDGKLSKGQGKILLNRFLDQSEKAEGFEENKEFIRAQLLTWLKTSYGAPLDPGDIDIGAWEKIREFLSQQMFSVHGLP